MLFYFDNEESKEARGGDQLEGCRVELCEAQKNSPSPSSLPAPNRGPTFSPQTARAMESWFMQDNGLNAHGVMELQVKIWVNARPPPLPPRRRPQAGTALAEPCPSAEDCPVSHGGICFSTLHEWYGEEMWDLEPNGGRGSKPSCEQDPPVAHRVMFTRT
ncbi:hypothetical protein FKM82_019837 [Ascaphus truei]